MIEQVAHFIQSEQLIPQKNSKVYAAVSGGVDSVVMLDVLYHLRDRFLFDLEILHYNHRVRGEAADEDARFVENLAHVYRLNIDVGHMTPVPQNVTETYLREQRYRFFKKYLKKGVPVLIATGHHRDDNIETFVMRLARGSRLKGLLAIAPKRDQFIRPLLQQTRTAIVDYAQQHGLQFRQDATNFENQTIRNKIRNEILPFLQRELNLEINGSIIKTMEDLGQYYDLFVLILQQAIGNTVDKKKGQLYLDRQQYGTYLPLIKRGLLEYCISGRYPLNYKLSHKNFIKWDIFVTQATPGKKYAYGDHGMALAERTAILFGGQPEEIKKQYRLIPEQELLIEKRYKLSMHAVSLKNITYSQDSKIEYIDGDKSGSDLTVRFWRAGDAFKPLGFGHHKKLSDFFIDLKLSAQAKKETPLVCNGDQIIWIAGCRLDDRFKISADTKKVYALKLQVLAGNSN
jgi:tRNA(Ile)-lysidine synthase